MKHLKNCYQSRMGLTQTRILEANLKAACGIARSYFNTDFKVFIDEGGCDDGENEIHHVRVDDL